MDVAGFLVSPTRFKSYVVRHSLRYLAVSIHLQLRNKASTTFNQNSKSLSTERSENRLQCPSCVIHASQALVHFRRSIIRLTAKKKWCSDRPCCSHRCRRQSSKVLMRRENKEIVENERITFNLPCRTLHICHTVLWRRDDTAMKNTNACEPYSR